MDGYSQKRVERRRELVLKTVDQLYKVSTLWMDDHQVKPQELKIVRELSETCLLPGCIEMQVLGKNWKTRRTMDS